MKLLALASLASLGLTAPWFLPLPFLSHPSPAPHVSAPPQSGTPGSPRCIYFMNNEPSNNCVISCPVDQDGNIQDGGKSTPTNGWGSNWFSTFLGLSHPANSLGSQSSICTFDNKFILALNSNSQTVTMLQISVDNPVDLTPLGIPTWCPVKQPVSIVVSVKNQLVCVLGHDGVSCASISELGIGIFDAPRPLNYGGCSQCTASTILFSDDESQVIVTVKGSIGFVAVFDVIVPDVGPCSLAPTCVQSQPQGCSWLAGASWIPGTSKFLTADALLGSVVLDIDVQTSVAQTVCTQDIQGSEDTCFSTVSQHTNTGWVSDTGRNQIHEVGLDSSEICLSLDVSAFAAGVVDLLACGSKIFALACGSSSISASLIVLDVSGGKGKGKHQQTYPVSHWGAGQSSQGLCAHTW